VEISKVGKKPGGGDSDNDPNTKRSCINVEYIKAQDKARLLKTTFFPTPLEPDLQGIDEAEYQDQIPQSDERLPLDADNWVVDLPLIRRA
jgi:hypothetical protein